MEKNSPKMPERTTFVVKDDEHGVIPLKVWCDLRGIRYKTILSRAWRAGLSDSEFGIQLLRPNGLHKDIFTEVRFRSENKRKKEGAESKVCSPAIHGNSRRRNVKSTRRALP